MSTKIEWTDSTWNPVTGCTKVSQGCKNCYAERLWPKVEGARVKRAGGTPRPFTAISTHDDRLDAPLHWREPRRVFVNSMSDLFHEDVPDEFIDQVFAVICKCCATNSYQDRHVHTFQILTKRAERMHAYMSDPARARSIFFAGHAVPLCGRESFPPWPPANAWLGVSAEDQATANERIPLLLQTPAAVRFVSVEPLLGLVSLTWLSSPTDPREWIDALGARDGQIPPATIDWVITGGESGPKARPSHPDWFRSLRDQCQAAGVPFFFKQWGEWMPSVDRDRDDPDWRADYTLTEREAERYRILNVAGGCGFSGERVHMMKRLGKRAAGRLLDGREWNEYPNDHR